MRCKARTLGRAARYLRRHNTLPALTPDAKFNRLVCQLRLSIALESGRKHRYNTTTGAIK